MEAVHAPIFLDSAIVLSLLVFVPHVGLNLKGAARWIELGPVSFQPEELLKFAMVMLLAAVYAANFRKVKTLLGGIVPLFLIAGSAAVILIIQPDTAGVIIIGMAAVTMLFAAGGKMSHLALLAVVGVIAIASAAYERPYIAQRIETFFNQEADPLGAGYQVQQSLIAVGSGELGRAGASARGLRNFPISPNPSGILYSPSLPRSSALLEAFYSCSCTRSSHCSVCA